MASSSCPSSTCPLARSSSENCWCSISLDEVTYIWTIDSFSCYENKRDPITSPTFSAPLNETCKWYLELEPYGATDNDGINLHLYLCYVNKRVKVCAKCSFSVLNEQEEECFVKYFFYEFDTMSRDEDSNYGWSNFLKKDDIANKRLLIDDKLTICCKLAFFEMNEPNIEKIFQLNNSLLLQYLSEDMGSMLQSRNFVDVVLSVQGKDYPVHKGMLSARSKVFAAMFHCDARENIQNRIEIGCISEEVMEEMLRYLYTGNCKNIGRLAEGLLSAAEQYDLAHLKRLCEESLLKNLTTKNAPNVLILADTYRACELKTKVIEFIVIKSSKIVNSANWNCIMPSYPHLLNEVCIALSRREASCIS